MGQEVELLLRMVDSAPHYLWRTLVISQARNALRSWDAEQQAGGWKPTRLGMKGLGPYTQSHHLDKHEQDMFLVKSAPLLQVRNLSYSLFLGKELFSNENLTFFFHRILCT